MPDKDLTLTLLSGLFCGGVFLLVFGLGLGTLFMFLPTLPLFSIGLSRRPHMTLQAALLAAAIIAIGADLPDGLLFLPMLGLPAWYITRLSLRWRIRDGRHEWLPIGLIFVRLMLFPCAALALATLYYSGEPGGLPHLLSQALHEQLADVPDDYAEEVDMITGQLSFMILPLLFWFWGAMLYAHAWMANRALAVQRLRQRADFAIHVFAMPNWMLPLLGICALASLIGSESMSFLGKAALIMLLFPYFLLGMALVQQASRKWQNRRFFLFFIYFMVLAQFWPAMMIAGIGLWHHIKRLSAGETSSKS